MRCEEKRCEEKRCEEKRCEEMRCEEKGENAYINGKRRQSNKKHST